MELGMVRKFFVRAWYLFCCAVVTVLGGCIVLFFALCYGLQGFARYFCDSLHEGIAAFIDSFEFASGISQRCD